MKTSYFGKIKQISNPLAICGKSPAWYSGPEYKTLAPKYSFFKDYKDGIIDETGYIEQYHKLVLKPLDAQVVYDHLVETYGEDVTLLCYEKPEDFCHRHIVAVWFSKIGIKVDEYG